MLKMLELYLSLPKPDRQERFVDTAGAAEITGLSRRTIQFWIEIGAIQAVLIGRRYQIDLHSLKDYLSSKAESWAGLPGD